MFLDDYGVAAVQGEGWQAKPDEVLETGLVMNVVRRVRDVRDTAWDPTAESASAV
jgi:hypothetical protein